MSVRTKHGNTDGLPRVAEKQLPKPPKLARRCSDEPHIVDGGVATERGDVNVLTHDGWSVGETHFDAEGQWHSRCLFYLDLAHRYFQFDLPDNASNDSRMRYYHDSLESAVAAFAGATGFLGAEVGIAWLFKKLLGEDYDLQGAAGHASEFVRDVIAWEPRRSADRDDTAEQQ